MIIIDSQWISQRRVGSINPQWASVTDQVDGPPKGKMKIIANTSSQPLDARNMSYKVPPRGEGVHPQVLAEAILMLIADLEFSAVKVATT
ncbi:jg4926 [Pararge aegeria aegeria]|uniref:Jg4926 protein n=1 Tax=Pararge aegeria aegeria TaxID=348720 RepID=A0A8S4SBK8_9NEOP|nr:jg4926 [Pararge aegeria aegeria]